MPFLAKQNHHRRGSLPRHRRRNSSPPSLKKLTASLKNAKTTTSRSMRPSLLVLSAVWFALCCCLVWKKQQLSQIFFSFVSCFVAAGLLHLLVLPRAPRWATPPPSAISGVVGATTCAAALWACLHHRRPYPALALVAGYLAFDHWYRALRQTMELSWGVVENAATLSVIVVWLATRHEDDDAASASLREHGAIKVQAWILYKLTALLWLLANVAASSSRKLPSTPSLQETSSSNEIQSPPSPPPAAAEQLWTIHGVEYDMRDFVSRHPGGEQAILLGQGRDCTALFESYHPFTGQHRVVLQRYRQPAGETKGPARTDQQSTLAVPRAPTESPARDEFYEVLCERVAQALQDKGIDPIRNRAATLQRTLYYIVVVVCVLAAGWAHVRVSSRTDQGAFPSDACRVSSRP
jgi:Cytochrome b5-like Heme/Steroid binding domain